MITDMRKKGNIGNIFEVEQNRYLKEKLLRAKKFFDEAVKCKFHTKKNTNPAVNQKSYWCTQIDNRCNLGTCPFNKKDKKEK